MGGTSVRHLSHIYKHVIFVEHGYYRENRRVHVTRLLTGLSCNQKASDYETHFRMQRVEKQKGKENMILRYY